MNHEHTIHGLLRRRQETAAALELAQGQVRQLVSDVDALDAVLRMFQPDLDIGAVRVRPSPRRHAAFRGESSRLILDMLREADGPMATRDIVARVMELRKLNPADRELAETMRQRVASSLRGLRQRGTVTSSEGRGAGVRWHLSPAND